MWLEIILIFLLILTSYHFYLRNGRIGRYVDQIPGPRAWPIIGNVPKFMVPYEELWQLVRKMNDDYYPLYRIWTPFGAVINIRHPDDVEIILSSMQHIEKSVIYSLLHSWFGTGLLTSSGIKWQQRRKILTPAFHFNVLQKFSTMIEENSKRMISSLKSTGKPQQNLISLITDYTLNVICETAMGTSLHEKEKSKNQYRRAIHDIGLTLVYRLLRPWFRPDWLFNLSPTGQKQKAALKVLHGFSSEIIEQRKLYHHQTNDEFLKKLDSSTPDNDETIEHASGVRKRRLAMLDLLIAANKKGDIDDAGIQEEVDTFMFEGHDTSAMGICFALLLLAEHKEVQSRARLEVDEVLKQSNGKMGISEIQQLNYLEQCIKESLRLYPSVPFIARKINQDVHLKKFIIPEGTVVHIHVYDLHRDPNFWPDPTKFNPDRFSPEKICNRHPYSFIPFSAGPRNCIGQKFAMMELKSLIAHILHNFYLEPIDLAHEVSIVCDLVIRPARPVHIKLISI